MRTMIAAAALLCTVSAGVRAQTTPAGVWRTFDDRTGRERAAVLIQNQDGVLTGRVVGTVDPAEGARLCEKCEGHGGISRSWG